MALSDHMPFTREDVERLKAIEISSGATAGALTALAEAMKVYEEAHAKLHERLVVLVTDNARFIRGIRKVGGVLLTIMTGSIGIYALDIFAKAMGWIH